MEYTTIINIKQLSMPTMHAQGFCGGGGVNDICHFNIATIILINIYCTSFAYQYSTFAYCTCSIKAWLVLFIATMHCPQWYASSKGSSLWLCLPKCFSELLSQELPDNVEVRWDAGPTHNRDEVKHMILGAQLDWGSRGRRGRGSGRD